MAKNRNRADIVLAEQGLAESREQAKRLIMAGQVFMLEHGNRRAIEKPGQQILLDTVLEVSQAERFVSRGGYKLLSALDSFQLDVTGMVALDAGASTGGFTDYLLKHGIKKVYAIDVGSNQLHDSLKNNSQVINLENTNFRYMDTSVFTDNIDIVTVDVSFISLQYILPKIVEISHDNTDIVVLIKPQFEAGKENVGKKGIIKDKKVHLEVLNSLNNYFYENNLNLVNINYSPIKGTLGNIEYLAHLRINGFSNEFNFKDLIKRAFEIL